MHDEVYRLKVIHFMHPVAVQVAVGFRRIWLPIPRTSFVSLSSIAVLSLSPAVLGTDRCYECAPRLPAS